MVFEAYLYQNPIELLAFFVSFLTLCYFTLQYHSSSFLRFSSFTSLFMCFSFLSLLFVFFYPHYEPLLIFASRTAITLAAISLFLNLLFWKENRLWLISLFFHVLPPTFLFCSGHFLCFSFFLRGNPLSIFPTIPGFSWLWLSFFLPLPALSESPYLLRTPPSSPEPLF